MRTYYYFSFVLSLARSLFLSRSLSLHLCQHARVYRTKYALHAESLNIDICS